MDEGRAEDSGVAVFEGFAGDAFVAGAGHPRAGFLLSASIEDEGAANARSHRKRT